MKFIESELNRCIGESTAARELLARLQGTSFAVHVEGLGLTGVLHADGERLRLDSDARDATATLSATPFDLVRLLRADGVSGVKRTRAALSGSATTRRASRSACCCMKSLFMKNSRCSGTLVVNRFSAERFGLGKSNSCR